MKTRRYEVPWSPLGNVALVRYGDNPWQVRESIQTEDPEDRRTIRAWALPDDYSDWWEDGDDFLETARLPGQCPECHGLDGEHEEECAWDTQALSAAPYRWTRLQCSYSAAGVSEVIAARVEDGAGVLARWQRVNPGEWRLVELVDTEDGAEALGLNATAEDPLPDTPPEYLLALPQTTAVEAP